MWLKPAPEDKQDRGSMGLVEINSSDPFASLLYKFLSVFQRKTQCRTSNSAYDVPLHDTYNKLNQPHKSCVPGHSLRRPR